ncbi:helix-turn-helix domain-containing protein [Leuconostoc lactis]|uniref:helix-turn-helix domain-containing protein n=2 Tax=Leuconostoc lactis TaxID=1246 RepID=UPI00242032DE|nr:helix-turn-helix transcriptional regulator [Leuconostoc lactis]
MDTSPTLRDTFGYCFVMYHLKGTEMTLFEHIKSLAKTRGMSLNQVAEKAGLGEKTIYKWKKQDPRTETLAKVADVLGVSVSYLIGENVNVTETNNPITTTDLREVDRDVLSYGGRPISERDWQIIKNILETGLDE